jgi:hypothetical protein
VVRKLGPDTVSRQKDRTGAANVFVRGYNSGYDKRLSADVTSALPKQGRFANRPPMKHYPTV